MLMYISQNIGVKRVHFVAELVNILLIFMSPSETFAIIKILISRSDKILTSKNSDEINRLRWHIPQTDQDYSQLVATFIDGYVGFNKDFSQNKSRKVLEKCS